MPEHDVVLEVIPDSAEDMRVIRKLFPNADEAVRIAIRLTEGFALEEVLLPVLRCQFDSVSSALAAAPSLPGAVRWTVNARIILDGGQVAWLARHHAHGFLRAHRLSESAHNQGGPHDDKPFHYDDLPRPTEFFTGPLVESPDPRCAFWYHVLRFTALESILGHDRLRDIYESMAAQPAREAAGDFDMDTALTTDRKNTRRSDRSRFGTRPLGGREWYDRRFSGHSNGVKSGLGAALVAAPLTILEALISRMTRKPTSRSRRSARLSMRPS